jgi:hypothetical protein
VNRNHGWKIPLALLIQAVVVSPALADEDGVAQTAAADSENAPVDVVAQTTEDEEEEEEEEATDERRRERDDSNASLDAIVPPGTLSSLTAAMGGAGATGAVSPLPVTIGGSVSMNTNVGSLVRPNAQTIDSVSLNFGANVSYNFETDTNLSVSASLQKFVTPHGLTRQYEARFGDLSVGLTQPAFYTIPGADIALTGSLSGTIPTSDFSRFMGLRTSIDASLSMSRSVGRFSFSYTFGAGKNFHRYTSIVFNPEQYEADALIRGDGAENISETRLAIESGVLPEWSVSNSLSMSVRLPENLSAQLGFSLSDSFTYATDTISAEDELQSEFARPGRGRDQAMSGRIGVGYRFLQRFNAGVSLATGGPPKTADNQRFRFPFWDFQGGNLQYTSLSVSLSGSY